MTQPANPFLVDAQKQLDQLAADAMAAKERAAFANVTLEQLLEDPLLGQLPLSPAQRALARAADGLPISHLSPEMLDFHFGARGSRELHFPGKPRTVIVQAGVRSGKSLIGAFGALLGSTLTCVMRRPPSQPGEIAGPDGLVGVRPGELVRALIVAPLLKASRQPFHHLVGSMKASPKLSTLIAGEPGVEHLDILRPDGVRVRVELVAASSGGLNLRSTWLAGILFDEADFHDDEDAAVNLAENYRAVMTRMLPGGQIWVVSSPWADEGVYHKMFTDAFGSPGRTVAFHSDTVSMNPTVDRADIEAERARDPDNAAREFDAVPLSAGSLQFFPKPAIELACVRPEAEWILPPGKVPHYGGTDLGFRKNSSALALAKWADGKAVLSYYEELRPEKGAPLKPTEVCRSFARTAIRYHALTVLGDKIYRDTAEEVMPWEEGPSGERAMYEGWDPTPKAQGELATRFLKLMSEGRLELPNDPRVKKQLEDTRKKKGPDGQPRIVLPKHGAAHGDVLMAIMLACDQVPAEGATSPMAGADAMNDDESAFRWGEDRGFG